MRLTNHSGGAGRRTTDSADLARVETLLRHSANFEPEIQPVDDFVRRALRRTGRRVFYRARPLILGFSSLASGVGVAAIVMFIAAHNEMVDMTVPPGVVKATPPFVGLEQGPKSDNGAPEIRPPTIAQSSAKPAESTVSTDAAIGRSLQRASYESRPRPERPVEKKVAAVPKVRWKTETVQRFDRGVMAPAYMVEERDHNGDVVYQPVMMPVTTETGARPVLTDGMPDTSIQLSNMSEETSNK
jgi:hypothetical protein